MLKGSGQSKSGAEREGLESEGTKSQRNRSEKKERGGRSKYLETLVFGSMWQWREIMREKMVV